MEMTLQILGAFETLGQASVDAQALLRQLQTRGVTPEDAALALDKALREGLLHRTSDGMLRAGSLTVSERIQQDETPRRHR